MTVATAAGSAGGLLDHQILHALRRDGPAISAGQTWRLLTSLLVQDGGIPGTTFNLLGLLAVGAIAERAFGRKTWIAAYLAGGLTGELVGWAGWQPVGAGNSVGVCGLAMLVALAFVAGHESDGLSPIVCVAWTTALLTGSLTVAAPAVASLVTRLAILRGRVAARGAVAVVTVGACLWLLADADIHGAALLAGGSLALLHPAGASFRKGSQLDV